MTQCSDMPPLNSDEKSSLRNILNRLGTSARNKYAPTSASASKKETSFVVDTMFSEEQASGLVDELLSGLEYAVDEPGRAFLVSLLQEMPARTGNAFEVADAYFEPLMVAIQQQVRTQEDLRPRAGMAELVFHLARQLHRNPDSAPWMDLKAFSAETDRLAAIPSKERTDDEKEYLRFLGQISESGLLRRRCPASAPAALMDLVARFPNFEEPLRFLAEQASFARLRGDANAPFIPILLAGPAGIGKTHFAMALAEAIGSRTEVLSMASQSCGFAIAGMDRGWSSARAGLVFNALMRGENLSPIIVLDEIDKASQEGKSDPIGPLYSLLEQRSSKAFKDEYAGIAVDASQVFWLATANDPARLPGPLLSRFKVFEIEAPRPEQMSSIAENLFAEIVAGMSGAPDRLPARWREQLTGHSVRDIRMALQQALGKAALRAVMSGRAALEVEDNDLSWLNGKPAKRIGFC